MFSQSVWYASYFSMGYYNNILYMDEKFHLEPDQPITREEGAKLLARALDKHLSPYQSPFCDTDDLYAVMLYELGIMQGTVDAKGNRYFYPYAGFTRAETCAVMNRASSYCENPALFSQTFFAEHQLPPLMRIERPKTMQEFYLLLLQAWANGEQTLTFHYNLPYSSNEMEKIVSAFFEAFDLAAKQRPEYGTLLMSNLYKTGNTNQTDLKITFDSDPNSNLPLSTLLYMNRYAVDKAKSVLSTILNDRMTDYEKACAIHDYLVLNTQYSEHLTDQDKTMYTSFGALVNGFAVCQGYASAFNLLCRMAGIRSIAVYNDTHMWNAVLISGDVLFFDTTWDDPYPDKPGRLIDTYRGISAEELGQDRDWDKKAFTMQCFDW